MQGKPDKLTRLLLGLVVVLVLGVLALQAWQHQLIYQDETFFWRETLAKNPEARNAYRNLGLAFQRQGRHEEALDAFRAAVQQRPDHARAYANIGKTLNILGRFEEAEPPLRRAIEMSSYLSAYFHLGNSLFGQGRFEEAVAAFRHVVEQNPDFPSAKANLAAAIQKQQAEQKEPSP